MSDPFDEGLAEGRDKRNVDDEAHKRMAQDVSALRQKVAAKLSKDFEITDAGIMMTITRKHYGGVVLVRTNGKGWYRCSSHLEGQLDGTLDDALRYVGRWVARQAP